MSFSIRYCPILPDLAKTFAQAALGTRPLLTLHGAMLPTAHRKICCPFFGPRDLQKEDFGAWQGAKIYFRKELLFPEGSQSRQITLTASMKNTFQEKFGAVGEIWAHLNIHWIARCTFWSGYIYATWAERPVGRPAIIHRQQKHFAFA